MNPVPSVAHQEVLSLWRDRIPKTMLAVFMLMVTLSSFIGWLTNRTVSSVWRESMRAGLTKAANPFANMSALYFSRNTVIYVVLIGALAAIVLGVSSGLRDRKAHTVDLILSRAISARALLTGKLLGLTIVLGSMLGLVACIAWGSLSLVIASPLGFSDTLRLLGFFLFTLAFLVAFTALGLISGARSRQETSALLFPIALWSLLTFVLPQVATGANPVSLLNPVPAPPTTDSTFQLFHQILGPISVTEQFKTVSGLLLANPDITGPALPGVVSVLVAAVAVTALAIATPRSSLREVFHD